MPSASRAHCFEPAVGSIDSTLARLLVSAGDCSQPPLADLPDEELTVVLPALALGGAERIVVDWATRIRGRYRIHLVLLRQVAAEYAIPEGVRVTRLGAEPALLEAFARELVAAGRNRVCLCHLITAAQRKALRRGGAVPVPVVHNASAGWLDTPDELRAEPLLIAVSRACADELRAAGITGVIHVIRHLPGVRRFEPGLRARWRIAWGIPGDALVVGMVGGVKPQKAYPFAVRVLAAMKHAAPGARLVIIGGPAGRDGARAWSALCAQRLRQGLERDVVLPGYVADAVSCLPAFDVLLNTSHHEGLSIATLEALAAGLPVVASDVGGQGEVGHDTLCLLSADTDAADWADAVLRAAAMPRSEPAWLHFAAYRQWTLAHLQAPYRAQAHALFVTANLNAGGAQRSLVNLATALAAREPLTIAVTGDSTRDAFQLQLDRAGVDVVRTAASRDAFDHAEALFRLARARRADVIVFWNVDAKVKLLVAKFAAAWPALRLVDVCPGAYAIEELAASTAFQDLIAFNAADYYARLDRLVQKFDARPLDAARGRTVTIRNGVREPKSTKIDFACVAAPSIVVSGRLAPTKFLVEILAAFSIVVRTHARAQLHIYGGVEPRHAEYMRAVLAMAGDELGRRVFLHGPDAGAPDKLHQHDVALVLGENQGCPNACLEALAAGVPLVANDSGGTHEVVIAGKTGWLVPDVTPDAVARALLDVLRDPAEARRRSRHGRAHAARRFSMASMADRYRRLFRTLRIGGTS